MYFTYRNLHLPSEEQMGKIVFFQYFKLNNMRIFVHAL